MDAQWTDNGQMARRTTRNTMPLPHITDKGTKITMSKRNNNNNINQKNVQSVT